MNVNNIRKNHFSLEGDYTETIHYINNAGVQLYTL
jgi:hypothetical protein